MDAHVTADATEQWIRLALRDGVVFDAHAIASRVPDCGYKLRVLEVEAVGHVADGYFIFASSKQRVKLQSSTVEDGDGVLRGHFEVPITAESPLVLDAFEKSTD